MNDVETIPANVWYRWLERARWYEVNLATAAAIKAYKYPAKRRLREVQPMRLFDGLPPDTETPGAASQ